MKRLLSLLALAALVAPPVWAQNTSIRYSLVQPPMATRQVPSASHYVASPGLPNSSWSLRGRTIRLKKRRSGKVLTSVPVVIFEPDLKNKPRVE